MLKGVKTVANINRDNGPQGDKPNKPTPPLTQSAQGPGRDHLSHLDTPLGCDRLGSVMTAYNGIEMKSKNIPSDAKLVITVALNGERARKFYFRTEVDGERAQSTLTLLTGGQGFAKFEKVNVHSKA